MAGRLRRREAVLRETPPAPPSRGGATSQLAALDCHKSLRTSYFTLMNTGTVTLEGFLCSGLGEGAGFTSLDWVDHQLHGKLGFRPHPGTVNLKLAGSDWNTARNAMLAAAGIAIEPPPGFCAAKCFAVLIAGRIEGAAILPDVDDYPADKLEIVAPVAVRRELHLQDGDRVALRLQIE